MIGTLHRNGSKMLAFSTQVWQDYHVLSTRAFILRLRINKALKHDHTQQDERYSLSPF